MKRILMVEDDDTILYALSELLKEEGFPSAAARSLKEAFLENLKEYCLVLLDLGLPDGEGFVFLERILSGREEGTPPVIILTAREDEKDIIKGLDLGADDYVTKPFKAGVLLSRIRAVLRRRGGIPEGGELLTCGSIVLDKGRTSVTVDGQAVLLTAGEFRILQYMMENKGRTLTRNVLLAHFWDNGGDYVNDNTLTVTVKRLREKLGEGFRQSIKTVRGIGYRMEESDD